MSDSRVRPGAVTAVLDGVMEFDPIVAFPGTTRADWVAHRAWLSPSGLMRMPYGGFLVRTPAHTNVLVDVGGGPTFEVPPAYGKLLTSQRLPRALDDLGVSAGSVDAVVLTHLHPDHIGWLAPEGRPLFPRAEVFCHEADVAHFLPAADVPEPRTVDLMDGVASRLNPWAGEQLVISGLVVEHTPGHTPGSSIVALPGRNGPEAIVGDLVHTPVEFLEQWDGLADVEPARAAGTRRQARDRFTEQRALVWGNHFPDMIPGVLGNAGGHHTWSPCC